MMKRLIVAAGAAIAIYVTFFAVLTGAVESLGPVAKQPPHVCYAPKETPR